MSDAFTIAQIGEPVLRSQATEVTNFGSTELDEFIDRLLASMIQAGGIGIAAPQVFYAKQIMIIASRPNVRYPDAPSMDPLVMINPIIDSLFGAIEYDWEGCLSVPGIRGYVPRYKEVKLSYQNPKGLRHSLHFSGFVARIFQHEYDHLVGKTFVDQVTSSRHLIAESVLPKILSGELAFEPK